MSSSAAAWAQSPTGTGGTTPAPRQVEVTVEGEPASRGAPPRARAVAGSVIPKERLVQPGASVAHVLREVPGVQVTEVGGLGAPATASVRGATAAQTPIYLGGVRINDEVGGAANLADVPLFMVDHAQVYRSHAPLVADRLGVGGAIFFEPAKPERDELVTGVELGSHGTRAGYAYGSRAHDGRGLLAGFKLAAAENDYAFFDDRGTLFSTADDGWRRVQNADARLANGWLHAVQPLGSAELTLLLHHSEREQGAPKLALTPSREARVAHRRDLVSLRSTMPMPAWSGDLVLATQAIHAETVVADPLGELGLPARETHTPGERLEQRIEASQVPFQGLVLRENLSIAVDRLRRVERLAGELEDATSARRLGVRLAGAGELALTESLYADVTMAVTCSDTSVAELRGCTSVEPEGRAGLSYRRRVYELYLNAARYYREPTLGERFGVALLVRGNSNLLPELGTVVEMGARWQHARRGRGPLLFVDLSGFVRQTEQLIAYVRTAQGYLAPANRDQASALGAEVVVGGEPVRWLEASTQVSVLDARDTSPGRVTTNDVLPFSSRLVSATLLTLHTEFERAWVNDTGITGKFLYQSNRYADPAGLGVIPEQSAFDLEFWLRALSRRTTTRVRLANVFDQRRFDVVGFPLPGRSAFLSVEATW